MISWHDALESTQDVAHELAAAGAPSGTAVAARRQEAGRGTRGRRWSSGDGGLWISIVVRPSRGEGIELLGIRIGLALADRLELESGGRLPLGLKWPNDLYAGDGKIAGVLAEARWQGDVLGWVVVGVGLNLSNDPPADVAPRPARAADFGWSPSPEAVAPAVVSAVLAASRLTGPLAASELERFAARDWLVGRRVRRPVSGRIVGITPGGRLRVDPDQGPPLELQDSSDLALER